MIYVTRNGEQYGPYGEDQLREMLAAGSFSYDDYGWKEGMPEWLPLRQMVMPASPPPFRSPSPVAFPAAAPAQVTIVNDSANKHLLYESQKKSAGLACFLNFLIPGIGYMYAGRVVIGILVLVFWGLMLLCAPFTFGLTFVVAGIIWLIGLIDGFLAVNRSNRKLAERLLR